MKIETILFLIAPLFGNGHKEITVEEPGGENPNRNNPGVETPIAEKNTDSKTPSGKTHGGGTTSKTHGGKTHGGKTGKTHDGTTSKTHGGKTSGGNQEPADNCQRPRSSLILGNNWITSLCVDIAEVTVADFKNYIDELRKRPGIPLDEQERLNKFETSLESRTPYQGKDSQGRDRTEESLAHSEACTYRGRTKLDAGGIPLRNSGGKDSHPINCVTQEEAEAYCKHQGMRLPTLEEWKWAARNGAENRKFPWGEAPPDHSNVHRASDSTAAVKSKVDHEKGPLYDMGGNVAEWTTRVPNQSCSSSGGHFRSDLNTGSMVEVPNSGDRCIDRSHVVGFRCVKNADKGR